MSMIGYLKQITPSQLKELLDNPDLIEGLVFEENKEDSLDLDKAWHGIHFLLNDDPWDGEEPLKFTIMGRNEIGEDIGYGPVRYLTSDDVKSVSDMLSNLSIEEIKSRFDAEKMMAADIYPSIWRGEEDLDYLMAYFQDIVKYYKDAAIKGNAMLTYLT